MSRQGVDTTARRDRKRGVPTPVRIVTLGDLVLDVLVTADARAARDQAGAVRIAPGGSAANFAVGAAQAGARVAFFGRVGDDVAGRLLVAELERGGVTPRVHVTPGGVTGSVLVMIGADGPGSSRMVSDPGASALLAPEDLDAGEIAAADVVHVTGYSWLREGPGPAARAAVGYARAGAAVVTFDPGPAHLIASYDRARLAEELARSPVDVLLPNLEEGAAMTGERDPRAIALALRALAPLVVLKSGADGAWVAHGDRVDIVPAAPVASVVDTTGAGDAFAAGFAVAYAAARDPVAAARAGAIAAAAVVARVGAR
jgi:sugar/nucleoside kinase (ribokinase family)